MVDGGPLDAVEQLYDLTSPRPRGPAATGRGFRDAREVYWFPVRDGGIVEGVRLRDNDYRRRQLRATGRGRLAPAELRAGSVLYAARGAYMMMPTPTRQMRAPMTS